MHHTSDHAAINQAIYGLYRAAAGEETWQLALGRVTAGYGGVGSFVAYLSSAGCMPLSSHYCSNLSHECVQKRAQLLAQRAICRTAEVLPAYTEQWPCFANLDASQGEHVAVLYLTINSAEIAMIVLLRHAIPPSNTAHELAAFTLSQHLCRAVKLFRQSQRSVHFVPLGLQYLHKTASPLFVLDQYRVLIAHNMAAQNVLQQQVPLLAIKSGTIVATIDSIEVEIASAFASFSKASAATLPTATPSSQLRLLDARFIALRNFKNKHWLALSIQALPFTNGADRDASVFLLKLHAHHMFAAAAPSQLPPQVLQGALGITRTEARVALAMHKGQSIDETAAEMAVCYSTVKTHLRALYRKLECAKQADVSRIVASLHST